MREFRDGEGSPRGGSGLELWEIENVFGPGRRMGGKAGEGVKKKEKNAV